jgi:chemotaxis protein methyltransferase WspC
MTQEAMGEASGLAAAEALLEQWIGLDPAALGGSAVARAIRARMEALGIDDVAAFAARLRHDPDERDQLVEDVVVGESWFFRDCQVFEFVRDVAVTRAAVPSRRPVRILCVPCAGGEEPYSVAMTLFDAGLTPGQFTIEACDVSRRGLERAARGRYSANAFRNADLSFRDRWFRTDGGAAVLDDRIRKAASFSRANLLEESFAAGREPYDVIFCRNLLIYLTPAARGRVEKTLAGLLRADGMLILGAAEPPILKGDWIPAGAASLFALRRGIHAPPAAPPARPRPGAGAGERLHRRPSSARKAAATVPGRPPAAGAADASGAAPPANGTVASPLAASLEEVLREAGHLANAHRYAEALAVCDRGRQALPPAPELFLLMGILHQAAGDLDRAEGCFHKTLYLDGGHEEALLALALLAARRGDARMADAYRQSAARAAARKGPA